MIDDVRLIDAINRWGLRVPPGPRYREVVIHGAIPEPLRSIIKRDVETNPEGPFPHNTPVSYPPPVDFEHVFLGVGQPHTFLRYHVDVLREFNEPANS